MDTDVEIFNKFSCKEPVQQNTLSVHRCIFHEIPTIEFADIMHDFEKLVNFTIYYQRKGSEELSQFVFAVFAYFFIYLLKSLHFSAAHIFYQKYKYIFLEEVIEFRKEEKDGFMKLRSLKCAEDVLKDNDLQNFWFMKFVVRASLLDEVKNDLVIQKCNALTIAFYYFLLCEDDKSIESKTNGGEKCDLDLDQVVSAKISIMFELKNNKILYIDLNYEETVAALAFGEKYVMLADLCYRNREEKIRVVTEGIKEPVFSVKFISRSSESKLLLGSDKFIHLYDTNSCKVMKSFNGHMSAILDMDIDASGHYLATVSMNSTAWIMSLSNGEVLHLLKGHTPKEQITVVKFDPERKFIAIGCSDKTVVLFTFEGFFHSTLIGHESRVDAIAFSPDGLNLSSADAKGNIKIWNVREQKIYYDMEHIKHNHFGMRIGKHFQVTSLCYDASGTILAATCRNCRKGFFGLQPYKGSTMIWSIRTRKFHVYKWIDNELYIPFFAKFQENTILNIFFMNGEEKFKDDFKILNESKICKFLNNFSLDIEEKFNEE